MNRPTIPHSCPREFSELIQRIWVPEPSERPDCRVIARALCHIIADLRERAPDEAARGFVGLAPEDEVNEAPLSLSRSDPGIARR